MQLSSPTTPNYIDKEDEINLFEIAETLWKEKWIIVCFSILVTLGGIIYNNTKEVLYEVKIPFDINLSLPVSATLTYIRDNLGIHNFKLGGSTFKKLRNDGMESYELTIESPLKNFAQEITNKLPSINQALTEKVLQRAKGKINSIQNTTSANLQSTETIATNLLESQQLVHAIESEAATALFFYTPEEKGQSPSSLVILTLCAFLGLMIGVFFVLMRQGIKHYQQQKQALLKS